ncbi:hypothetical protein DYB32_007717 [Aphanomyces invadans]|uniref:Protein kinase domain-containing protein n=1 Tax=Aphanomyces invadans TaxID=157072 RepID=A0A418ANP6_9STRA|nr:hypothetical protein DYB32_007717 [Aphanomyces invadans]
MEGTSGQHVDAMLLSKAKDDVTLSEPILTPFPPRYGRSYSLLPPKDIKLGRVSKVPAGLLTAQYHKTAVTLHRLDYRDQDQACFDSFLQKLEFLATLVHPNVTKLVGATKLSGISICAVFDHGSSDQGLPSFLFQVANCTPDLVVHSVEARMRQLAVGVASAAAYLHATTDRPLARLLTSTNVSVRSSDGSVRLNTMPWMNDPPSPPPDDDSKLSYGSFVMATVAPELVADTASPASPQADVFALGILLGEIATCGRPYATYFTQLGPVAGDARIHEIYTNPSAAILPFPTLREGLVAQLIAACLHRDPVRRPTTTSVVASLHACLADIEATD